MPWRAPSGCLAFACLALAGCSRLIGADELEYTLSDSGAVPPPSIFGDCAGIAGPVPVNIEGMFCIDGTEVTNAQYLKFLDEAQELRRPDVCAWKTAVAIADAFRPVDAWPPDDAKNDHPVRWVDWCDAWSYCNWAGKRLCGRIDGVAADLRDYDTTDSEYFYACSRGGERDYPYAEAFDASQCPAPEFPDTLPVGSVESCQGAYPGLYDISGGLAEWIGLCADTAGAKDLCRIGPTAVREMQDPDSSRCNRDSMHPRDSTHQGIGVRCCSDAL